VEIEGYIVINHTWQYITSIFILWLMPMAL